MAAHNLQQHCPCCEFTALKHRDWIEYNSDQNIVELDFLKTLLVNSTERILQKTIWCIFCRFSFWNGYITNQLRWQTNGLQRQAVFTFSSFSFPDNIFSCKLSRPSVPPQSCLCCWCLPAEMLMDEKQLCTKMKVTERASDQSNSRMTNKSTTA